MLSTGKFLSKVFTTQCLAAFLKKHIESFEDKIHDLRFTKQGSVTI
jgi:hypothetical protein